MWKKEDSSLVNVAPAADDDLSLHEWEDTD